MTETKTRTFEIEVELDAGPEEVWRAITDPAELTNWFPLKARVEPGRGGILSLSWGEAFTGNCRIQEWDPPRHLRTSWMEQPAAAAPRGGEAAQQGTAALLRDDPEGAAGVAVDYTIEGGKGEKGKTVLRLVHSGFSVSPKWDEEYDGVSRGWTHELGSLKHYLARHHGERRNVAWVRREIGVPASEAWSRLMSSDGLLKKGKLDRPVEGKRYEIELASGDRMAGVVQMFRPGTDFAGTIEGLNDGLFRVGIESCFGSPEAQLWISTWGVPEADLRAIEGRLTDMMTRLFPAGGSA